MCGRYKLEEHWQEYCKAAQFNWQDPPWPTPNPLKGSEEARPTDPMPIIRRNANGELFPELRRWGFIMMVPGKTIDKVTGEPKRIRRDVINAMSEKLTRARSTSCLSDWSSMKPLVLNVACLVVAAISFLVGGVVGNSIGLVSTVGSAVAACWQYYETVPYRMKTTKDMFTKNAAGDWGVFVAGKTHNRGEHPKVTLRAFNESGGYVEVLSSTRYLGRGDLEIDSWPMALDVEIRR